MSRKALEGVAGAAFLVAFVAAQFFLGIAAAARVADAACIVTGVVWLVGKSVPVGVEGRPPSFFVRGAGAAIACVAIAALGIILLIYAGQAACLLGWGNVRECP